MKYKGGPKLILQRGTILQQGSILKYLDWGTKYFNIFGPGGTILGGLFFRDRTLGIVGTEVSSGTLGTAGTPGTLGTGGTVGTGECWEQ